MINIQDIPTHVAIIMDGNRRWAKKRLLPRAAGHLEGVKRIEPLVEYAAKKGIKYLTFWAFSTENWQRGEVQVEELMEVFRRALKDSMLDRLSKNGVAVNVIGDLSPFPKDIVKKVNDIMSKSKNNKSITVNFALNYGGRAEVLRAVKKILINNPKNISEELFSSYMYTVGQPDPDLIIRTGGEKRLSGFLPWQTVYSELHFTDTYWPDFDTKAFDGALRDYKERVRRFGK